LKNGFIIILIGGVGVVLAYPGHESGKEELAAVSDFLKNLPARSYEILRLENHNRMNTPPILYVIKKL